MNALVPIAMLGWPLVALVLFAWLPKHRAVIAAFIVAWLFLPVVHEPILGTRITKIRVTCGSVLFAALLLDFRQLLTFRPRLIDLPIVVWCISPVLSTLANLQAGGSGTGGLRALTIYDGLSKSFENVISWGTPYFIGRVYLSNLDHLRDLALGVIWGGLVYAPLCLIEIRLSPQLHTWVYGYFPHTSFGQTIRYGGFRPVVFMEHGLAVGDWMSFTALTAFWIWRARTILDVRLFTLRAPMALAASILLLVTGLAKCFGAIALAFAGALTLLFSSWTKLRLAAILLCLIPLIYIYSRVYAGWTGMNFADAVGELVDPHRAQSFVFRLENENILIDKAMGKPLLGWGGWGRSRVYDEEGNDLSTTDGLWIIVFGEHGFVGLIALGMAIGLPAGLFLLRVPASYWGRPEFAAPAVMAIALVLYLIDGLANAMVNPLYMVMSGGLAGIVTLPRWRLLDENGASRAEATSVAVWATANGQNGVQRVRAVAKYGPGPHVEAAAPTSAGSGVDEECPAP